MRALLRIAVLLPMIVLAACANQLPSQPARFDPYQGLMAAGTRPKEASERPPIRAAGKSIALVVTDSTETQFKYISDTIAALKSAGWMYVWRDDIETKQQPTYFVGQIVNLFKTRFARAELVDDFNAATAGRFDYIAVIDLGIRKPTDRGVEFAYDADIDLLTPRIERIVHLAGHGVARNACMGVDCGLATDMRALDQAMQQLQGDFNRNVQ